MQKVSKNKEMNTVKIKIEEHEPHAMEYGKICPFCYMRSNIEIQKKIDELNEIKR